jgi:hypothetical protein
MDLVEYELRVLNWLKQGIQSDKLPVRNMVYLLGRSFLTLPSGIPTTPKSEILSGVQNAQRVFVILSSNSNE